MATTTKRVTHKMNYFTHDPSHELFVFRGPGVREGTVPGLTLWAVAAQCRVLAAAALKECTPILRRHGLKITPALRQAFNESSYTLDQRVARRMR